MKTWILALLVLCCVGPAQADLKAGAAKVDITPDVKAWKVPLGGYFGRKGAPATGVHDPVYARALVLTEGTTKLGIVSLDLCFLPANVKTAVLSKLEAEGVKDLDSDHLLLAATHSHTAPDPLALHQGNSFHKPEWTPFDARLLDFTAGKIADAIALANRRLIPARIGSGNQDLPGKNRNRRGEKTVDPTMTLLKVTDAEGRSLAAVVNFAAHPTLYDEKMMEVSADWPGAMTGWVEGQMGGDAVCLFLNGAEGDATTNGAMGATAEARVAFYGKDLGQSAWDLWRIMATRADTPLAAWTVSVKLPPRKPNALFLTAASSFGANIDEAKQVVQALMPEASTLSFLRIGDLLLMGFPCEPSGDLGLAAKAKARAAGFPMPAVVALANDWLAYALTPEQYHLGNYEAAMSFYGDQLGPTLLSSLETGMKSPEK